MRDDTVARNYAETLVELAECHEGLEAFSEGIQLVADLLNGDDRLRRFVETPRIADEDRKEVLRRVFEDHLPRALVNFVLVTVDKRRQRLLRSIAREFHALVDEHLGREHVDVTVARPVDSDTEAMIATRLTSLLGKKAIPHLRVDPSILGGIVVRTGDTILDGSVRRQMDGLRRQLLDAPLPSGAAA